MKTMDSDAMRRLEELDPFRRIDFNWRQAEAIVEECRRFQHGRYHDDVTEAVRYLRALKRCKSEKGRSSVDGQWPDLVEARALTRGESPKRWEIEARILAGQSDEEVAKSCGVSPTVVRWFESLFFQVRPWLGATDWIFLRAIRPETFPCLGFAWRHSGYFYGPLILELVITISQKMPLPDWVRDIPGADAEGFDEELQLKIGLMIEWLLLPADVDPRVLFRIREEVQRYQSEKPQDHPGSSRIERLNELVAATRFERPSQKQGAGSVVGA